MVISGVGRCEFCVCSQQNKNKNCMEFQKSPTPSAPIEIYLYSCNKCASSGRWNVEGGIKISHGPVFAQGFAAAGPTQTDSDDEIKKLIHRFHRFPQIFL